MKSDFDKLSEKHLAEPEELLGAMLKYFPNLNPHHVAKKTAEEIDRMTLLVYHLDCF